MSSAARKALAELARHGLLMHADAALPSVTTLVAGEPIRGSWWGHPKGHAIFAVLEEIDDSDEATSAKLVNGKVTFVHRELWPALAAVGAARETWQEKGLAKGARELLAHVEEVGELRTDSLPRGIRAKDAGELERRLLVHAHQIHTESGRHARVLTTWKAWTTATGIEPPANPEPAKEHFETIVAGWRERTGARAQLPWRLRRG